MTLRCVLLVSGAALLVGGCASVTTGTGSVRTSAHSSSTSPAPSSTAPASASTSVVPSGSTSTTTSTPPCTADYCDDFSSAATGWPVENTARYYASYTDYLGGTYRMGERTANAKTQLAPVDTTTISKDYGVRIDVDAVLGKTAPTGSFLGIVCWDHKTSTDAEAGFLFFVTAASVYVALLPDTGGAPHTLSANESGNFVKPYPATNHLTATCVQRTVNGTVTASLSLVVNGAAVLHEEYAKSVKNYPWSPGSRAGLLVGGAKSDAFYDNFSISAE